MLGAWLGFYFPCQLALWFFWGAPGGALLGFIFLGPPLPPLPRVRGEEESGDLYSPADQ